MKIQKTSENINFVAYYRIPYKQSIPNLPQGGVMPLYGYIKNKPILVFLGDYLLTGQINHHIDKIAKSAGGSVEWLRNNAKNFGVNFDKINTSYVTVVTGYNDITEFENFALKQEKQKRSGIINKLKTFFKALKIIKDNYDVYPRHILSLKIVLNNFAEHINNFNEFMSSKNKIHLNSIEDLIKIENI